MTYLKDNRTVRFEEIESDRLREESDVEENAPGIEHQSNLGKFFSSATRYHSDAMLHFEAGNLKNAGTKRSTKGTYPGNH
ncbi:MAG: hypothetical protein IPO07_30485 [Haliscomenobacter sp.]|nr:hypothetical protein [Haliscomenobacter sp.]MBK9492625.1 hypothetical protein [Haliscomenobacter sp.]